MKNQEMKHELLLMLKAFICFLESHDIQYSIMSGTMLGAIRHGGFIPWDDDIDIGLRRDEYEKLVSVLKENNTINDFMYSEGFELGIGYWPFIKIYNRNVVAKERNAIREESLWIDVFPFDYVNRRDVNSFMRKVKILRRLYDEYSLIDGEYKSENNLKSYVRRIALSFLYLTNRDKITSSFIMYCKKNSLTPCDSLVDATWGKKDIPAYLFDEFADYEFEGIVVKGFKDYDTYLKTIYGDYMKLPPENQRITHGLKAWRLVDEK